MADFTVLAVLTGVLAPSVFGLVVEYTDQANGQALLVMVPVGLVCGVVGLVVGPVSGGILHASATWLRDWPWILFPAGFPLGFAAGALPAWGIARALEPWSSEAHRVGFVIGGVSGGLILGAVWLPYLAMRLQGRAGWPVMVLMGLLSPAIGLLVVAGTATLFEQLRNL